MKKTLGNNTFNPKSIIAMAQRNAIAAGGNTLGRKNNSQPTEVTTISRKQTYQHGVNKVGSVTLTRY